MEEADYLCDRIEKAGLLEFYRRAQRVARRQPQKCALVSFNGRYHCTSLHLYYKTLVWQMGQQPLKACTSWEVRKPGSGQARKEGYYRAEVHKSQEAWKLGSGQARKEGYYRAEERKSRRAEIHKSQEAWKLGSGQARKEGLSEWANGCSPDKPPGLRPPLYERGIKERKSW